MLVFFEFEKYKLLLLFYIYKTLYIDQNIIHTHVYISTIMVEAKLWS